MTDKAAQLASTHLQEAAQRRGRCQLGAQSSAVGLCLALKPRGSSAAAVQLPPAEVPAQQMLSYGQAETLLRWAQQFRVMYVPLTQPRLASAGPA